MTRKELLHRFEKAKANYETSVERTERLKVLLEKAEKRLKEFDK